MVRDSRSGMGRLDRVALAFYQILGLIAPLALRAGLRAEGEIDLDSQDR